MLSVPLRSGSAALGSRVLGRILAKQTGSNASVIVALQARSVSSADVFNVAQTASTFDLPPLPTPPPATKTISEMVESGESVLGELGLFTWWKPSSYFRIALEGIHTYVDIPWWGTIISATVILRLLMIGVPIMSQKLVAKQSHYRKEMEDFRLRIEEARKENNALLQQQILLEQRDFLKSKDIKLGRQFMVLIANGAVFATQFFALKRMVEVNYPGLSTGGAFWFQDLTVSDPYYALPVISALTMAAVTKVGIEMGTSSDQMPPVMRAFMQYGLPVVIFGVSTQFSSGICVYWCASNMMSLFYAGLFKVQPVRNIFGIPEVKPLEPSAKKDAALTQIWKNYKDSKSIPPSMADLKRRDATTFKKAGRGKPLS